MINYNLEQVLPLGVLTGSRAFNCSTKDSDWDIVIVQANLPNFQFAGDYTFTDFLSRNTADYVPIGHTKTGYWVDKHLPDLGEDFDEYDKSTIWGPL